MDLVLVNHYAGSPKHGMEFRPHQLARHWVAAGHDVTILAGSYSHLRNLNPTVAGRVLEEEIDGIRYRWLRTPKYSGNGIRRIRSMHAFLRGVDRERREFLSSRNVDAVIASSTYPFDIDPCRRIAEKKNATLVWEVHDLWPLSAIELSGFSPRHPFIRITQRAEDRCCRDAGLVVSILPRAIDHLRTRGLDESRYVVIPNGAEPAGTPSNSRPATLVRRHREAGRFTIAYAGGHGDYHALDTLLEAIHCLDSNRFGLVLIGDGTAKDRLKKLASRLDLPCVDFHDRVDRASSLAALSEADASYVGLRRHPIYRFGIGLNKIYDGMLAGQPIVGSFTAANDPITEAGCGIRVESDDAESLAKAISTMAAATPEDRAEMGARGTEFVQMHHNYQSLADRFIEAINTSRSLSDSGAES